jgi:ABC-2 type transport system permease protein
MSRFREIFRFEVDTILRRPSTWIYLALLLALAVLSPAGKDPGDSTPFNAPLNVAGFTLLSGFVGVLITAALFGDAGSRDTLSGMHPLFYAAPLRKHEYLGGRFAGAFAVNALLLLAIPLGMIGITLSGAVPADWLIPFRPASYIQAYLLFLLPNLLVNAAILFALTVLSRRAFPSYLGAIGLFAGYALAIVAMEQLDHTPLVVLLDPTGFVAVMETIADWTPVERQTQLLGSSGPLLLNRLFWVAVALAVLAYTYVRFRFAHTTAGGRRQRATEAEVEAVAGMERPRPVAIPAVAREFGWRGRMRQTLAAAGQAFREILVSRDFLFVTVGLVLFIFGMGSEMIEDDRFGIPAWPLTQNVSGFLRSFYVAVILSLLTGFYAGELVWRERDARVSEIVDAAPVPDGARFLGKFLALGLMIATLQAVLTASGMLLQTLLGYHRYEPGLYLRVLFGMQMVDYLLLAVVALLVHALVNQKYVGHLIVLLFYLATEYSGLLKIRHNLLVYGSDPGWSYSDMAGFGPFLGPWTWFKLYWAAWALLFAVLASLFWVRGTESGLRRRIRLAGRRFTRPMAAGAGLAVVLILSLGGFVFYNTSVLAGHNTAGDQERMRVEYEKRYKRFEYIPQPWLTHARLQVEIHPERRQVELRGTYHLVNRSAEPIDSVHVSLLQAMRGRSMEFDRPATRVLADRDRAYRIYVLRTPLQPGDSLQMRFALAYDQEGFPDRGIRTAVIPNGTFFGSNWLPSIGYQRDYELPGTAARRDHGLPRRDYRPSIHDEQARRVARSSTNADWIQLETTIGTAEDQTAVAPGVLHRTWTENGRRYFHYRTDAPILNFYAFLSARYHVHETEWNGVKIQVYEHPGHDFNRERIVRAARESLDYYSRNFGPYPRRTLRLVEFPRYERFARAYPGQIVYSEGSSVLARPGEGDFDSPSMVIAHEIGHQWWGNQVMGADVQGSQVLSETLAQYSALMVLEKIHGREMMPTFLRTMQIEYLNRRGSHANPEVPLLLSGDHDYLHYRKGSVVMYTLREYIGEERINTALRRVVERFRFGGAPYPTSLDLYEELRAVTPDSLTYLLEDLVATITLWDLRTTDVRAVPAGGGAYRVTLQVEARKMRADSVGNDTDVPMNDLVEVAVFGEEDGSELGRPLYLRKHRIRTGRQTITVTVPGRPARAGVDPYQLLLNRHKEEMDEKVREVELGS